MTQRTIKQSLLAAERCREGSYLIYQLDGGEHVAKELEISPYYLSRMLKKCTGKNFTDLLSEKRVEEAKKLLHSNKSIKEITYEVGFNSQNYFTKIFKKYENCTPTEYRAKGGW